MAARKVKKLNRQVDDFYFNASWCTGDRRGQTNVKKHMRALFRSVFGLKVKSGQIYEFVGNHGNPFASTKPHKVKELEVSGKWYNESMETDCFRCCYRLHKDA